MKITTKVDGGKIREARKGAGLSQSQLADKIGAHVTSVSDWERGRNVPSPRHLYSIAEATGQQMEFFRGRLDRDRGASVAGDRSAAGCEGACRDAA